MVKRTLLILMLSTASISFASAQDISPVTGSVATSTATQVDTRPLLTSKTGNENTLASVSEQTGDNNIDAKVIEETVPVAVPETGPETGKAPQENKEDIQLAQNSSDTVTITSENVDQFMQKSVEGCTSTARCSSRIKQSYGLLGESLRRQEATSKERNEAIKLSQTLTESLDQLNKEYDALREKLNQANQDKLRLEDELAAKDEELADLRAKLGAADKDRAKLTEDLNAALAENEDLKAKLREAQGKIDDLTNERDRALKELERLKKQLADANKRADDEKKRADDLEKRLADALAEIERLKKLVEEGEKAKAMLASLFGDLSKINVEDLRQVTLTGVNPQDWLINNVYLRYLRNEDISNLAPLSGSMIATERVEAIQREMNAWMVQHDMDLVKLGLPLHDSECGTLLCLDGIVGIRTRQVAIEIDKNDSDFWRGSARYKEKKKNEIAGSSN